VTKKQLSAALTKEGIDHDPKAKVADLEALVPWVPDWLLDPRTTRLPPSLTRSGVVRSKPGNGAPYGGGNWVQAFPPDWL